MKKLILASALMGFAHTAHAADLTGDYGEYSFIQDNAPAQPAIVGHLDMGIGYVDAGLEFGGTEQFWLFEGFGRTNVDLGGAMNLELEAGAGHDFKDSEWSGGVATHLWAALPNAALGIYGSVSFPQLNDDPDDRIYKVGLEGEAYLGALTLGASGDYNWFVHGTTSEFWVARAWADVYPTENTRIGGGFMYLVEADTYFDVWGGNLDGEVRFAGTPVSAWIEGRYRRIEHLDADIWTGMIGFRLFLDAPGTTLHEHDKLVPWDNAIFDPFTFN